MKIVEEKLERFEKDIMADVETQKQAILGEFHHAYFEEFDKKETEYLTDSYYIIQNGLKKIDKEKNEILSKVTMDNKMQVLNKRTAVIVDIFNLAKNKLNTFRQSDAYYDYLVQMIQKDLEDIGPGEIELYLDFEDQKYAEKLQNQFKCIVHIENKNIDLIGGCRIMNKTANLFIDDSFVKRLDDQKESFLQNCKIDVGI